MLKDGLLTGEEKVRCDEQLEWKPLREIDGIEIQKKSPPPIKTSKAPPVLIAKKSPPKLIGKKSAPDIKKSPSTLNVNDSDSKPRSQNQASGKKALYVIIIILLCSMCFGGYLLWRNQKTERQMSLDLQERELKAKEEANKAIAASEEEKKRVQEQLEKTQEEKLRLEREAQDAQEAADYGEDPFIGEYSTNQKYADLKISKKLSGEFNLSVKESEKEDWRELAGLRPATTEELQQALGDRWDRVQSSLVLQDGLFPKLAFYYIKPGQFGTDLIHTPTCMLFTQKNGLSVIDKFSPEKAAAFDAAKENHAKALLQKIENLKNAEVFAMPPYGDLFTDENKRETQMREKMQDKVLEWTVFVNDVTKHEGNYKLTTSTDTSDFKTCRVNSIKPTIVIVSPNAEERKAIEALASGEKIKVRGHSVVPEDGDISNLILHPAILITDSAISKSEAGCISELINLTSSEFLSLEKLQRELAVPSLTTLQKNKIINAYEGKIVEGSIFVGTNLHQHAMTGNAFWGMEVKENYDHSLRISELETKQKEIEKLLNDSRINDSKRQMLYDEMETISEELVPLQNLRESDVSESRQINTALDVIITSQNNMEYNWLKEYKSEGIRKPIQFRGVINSIKFEEIPEIRIWPAILKPHANPLADSERPMLGINMGMSPEQKGVIVVGIIDGSPAALAGLKVADIIVALDGNKIENSDDLLQLLTKRKAGDRVKFDFLRDNIIHSASATLTRMNELLELERGKQKLDSQ